MVYKIIVISIFISLSLHVEGALKRCFSCRSRGELGTCKDPFIGNNTQTDMPCASGWCGKILEGGNTYKDDDYGIATQRMCMQRGPSDNEERCAYTVWNYKKVYMCFCVGDLCNESSRYSISHHLIFLPLLLQPLIWRLFNYIG